MRHVLAAAYGVLLLVAIFGLFSNLEQRRLWGDEAETAVLAVNITRFGVPQVDDGRNVIANLRDRGDSNDAGIWTWSPWLDEYLTAASFLALGPSTRAARLPFAAAALASALLLAWLSFRWTRSHGVALTALTLYVTCVPVLLHGRQARYYALLMLAELWLMHGLWRCLQHDESGEGWRPALGSALHVGLPLAALFYCNYIVVPGNLLALGGLGALVWLRDRRPPRELALGIGIFALLAAPWLLYAPPGGQLGGLGLRHFWASLAYYLSELHFHFVPWVVLALPVGAYALRRLRGERLPPPPRESSDLERFVWFLLLASILICAISPLRFFRYLIPLAAPLIFLAAVLIQQHIRPRWVRVAFVVVLALTNAVAVVSLPIGSHELDSPYLRFARSLGEEHRERLDDVLAYLESEAHAGEAIWVADPEFPLIFYSDLRIIDARYHPLPEELPEWVFATSASGVAERRPLELPAGVRTLYREVPLVVRHSARGGARPDPHAYEWSGVPPGATETLRIFRRRQGRKAPR